jgi:hypothetical protein
MVEILAMRLNEPQPAEQFDIRFPAGCRVSDRDNGGKEYLMQPDGIMRELSPTGDVRASSEPEASDWRPRWFEWLLVGFWLVLMTVVWRYAVRNKRANAA